MACTDDQHLFIARCGILIFFCVCLIPLARSLQPKAFLSHIFPSCVSEFYERNRLGGFSEQLRLCAIVMYTPSEH